MPARSSAQLERHPGGFCRTGFCAPCRALAEGCGLLGEEHMGIIQQNQNVVQIGLFVSYLMECESAKSRSAVAQLEMHQ